jgi:Flp pilus assembly protein TadG
MAPVDGETLGSPTRDLTRDIFGGNAGQSLVEVALALPLLLLILIGLADVGRAFYYTTAVASAARQGAAYVAATASPVPATLKAKACAATGLDPSGNCGPALTAADVTATGCDNVTMSGTVAVQVTYDLQLISGYLVNRIFPSQTVTLRACATYPSLRS